MPNYELKNDTVLTIPIHTADVSGTVEPPPAGDVFSVSSSNASSLGAAIAKDDNGNPTLVVTPLVQASPGITVVVSDSSGLTVASQVFDIVPDTTDTQIILDLADATTAAQAVPANTGP